MPPHKRRWLSKRFARNLGQRSLPLPDPAMPHLLDRVCDDVGRHGLKVTLLLLMHEGPLLDVWHLATDGAIEVAKARAFLHGRAAFKSRVCNIFGFPRGHGSDAGPAGCGACGCQVAHIKRGFRCWLREDDPEAVSYVRTWSDRRIPPSRTTA